MASKIGETEPPSYPVRGVPILDDGIGTRIKAVAEKVGGEEKLSKVIGVSVPTVYRYENGATEPSVSALVRMAEASGFSMIWIATGQGSREETSTARAIASIELEVLTASIVHVEQRVHDRKLSVGKRARLIALVYSDTIERGAFDADRINTLVDLAI